MNWDDQGRRPDQVAYSARLAARAMELLLAVLLLLLVVGCGKDPATAPVRERACRTDVRTGTLRNAAGDSIGTYTFLQRRCA